MAPGVFQSLTRWANSPLFYVFKTLPDTFCSVRLCGDIEQPLISLGVLHNGLCFSIDGEYKRPLRFLQMLHELGGIPAEVGHGLDIFFYIEHHSPNEGA